MQNLLKNVSAKLTAIFYILTCFEVGAMLVFLPWLPYWNENFFLFYITSLIHSDILLRIAHNGYVRGAVTGLGVINILIGIIEVFNFQKIVGVISSQTNDKKQD